MSLAACNAQGPKHPQDPKSCLHCGLPLPRDGVSAGIPKGYCCRGCAAVAALLRDQGLGRYYDLAGDKVRPVASSLAGDAVDTSGRVAGDDLGGDAGGEAATTAAEPVVPAWLSRQMASARTAAGAADGTTGLCRLEMDVQGVYCAACVWLFGELFRRQPGGAHILVNPALGKVTLTYDPDVFDVPGWVRAVSGFGYRFGPSQKSESKKSRR